jgi:uncharacterized membrane protein HdeD (DUF308 family)
MSSSAATPGLGTAARGVPDSTDAAREVAGFWWLWLVVGVAWIAASLVVLQFDQASITTIGLIVGAMFIFAGVQQLILAALTDRLRWLWAIFGVLFLISGVICFINPEKTFAGLADILGFLFLTVGIWWTVQAFVQRDINPVWWLGLISGLLMTMMAFWTSGQFFIEKAYTLLVFAGIWAMLHGISDIARAFMVRSMRNAL